MTVSILKALDDSRLFGGVLRDKATWGAWRAFLAALFALPMSDVEAGLYRQCTGRSDLPQGVFSEAVLVCGRRAGKSFVLALIAVYLACFRDYMQYLGPGERATVKVIAADRRQARVIMRYVKGLLAIPALVKLVEGDTADGVDLVNQVTIEVGTASHKTLRGYTLAAALCDELAFWPQEDSASPDFEIIAAVGPAMATIPGAVLLEASSPYSRRGVLWERTKDYYGKDDPNVLVWKAPTRVMNPTVPQRVIDDAYERDPANAAAEFGAEFRLDIDAFIGREAVEACVELGIYERAPLPNIRYVGFVDPSGGSADSFTLSIGHLEKDGVATVDLIREVKPPFSPEGVAADFSAVLKAYGLSKATGDRYAGEWPREQFRKNGIAYEPSEKSKSEIYGETLPLINSRKVNLLDDKRSITQLLGLERRTARSGKDSIDHGPGSHDDRINAIAGALVLASTSKPRIMTFNHEFMRLAAQPGRSKLRQLRGY